MSRQWSFLKRVEHAGRAHEMTTASKPGQYAILCWACPHDGINLPDNWRNVDPRFL